MLEAFNLDLLDDLRRRSPTLGRSRSRSLRWRIGRALIAIGRRLDHEPPANQAARRPAADCA